MPIPSTLRAQILAARASAAARGERLPRTLRRPPRQQYPLALEIEYQRLLAREVERWGAEVLGAVSEAFPALVASTRHRSDDAGSHGWAARLGRIVSGLVSRWGQRAQALAPAVDAVARRIADFSYNQTQSQLRAVLGVDVLGAEPWLHDELHAFGVANARLIRDIGDQTARNIERRVADAVRAGDSTASIKNAIAQEMGTSDQRARLIARDQVGKLNGNLTRIRHERAGIDRYKWRGMLDRRERPAHRVREGVTFAYENPPPDGNPGEPVQCRCHPEPVLDEFADLMDERPAPNWEAIGRPPRERRRWGPEYDQASAREMDRQAAARATRRSPPPPPPPPAGEALERAREGTHFRALESPLSGRQEREVLRGLNQARALGFLERHPLADLRLLPDVRSVEGEAVTGKYVFGADRPDRGTAYVNTSRAVETIGQAFRPGRAFSVSSAADTPVEAMKRTLVHEFGHHLKFTLGANAHGVVVKAWVGGARPITVYARSNPDDYFAETHAAYVFHRDALRVYDPAGYAMVEEVRRLAGIDP